MNRPVIFSFRVGFTLAVMLLLCAAGLRLWQFSRLPAGMSESELLNVRVTERLRAGTIEVFYRVQGQDAAHHDEGREGLDQALLALVTSFVGNGEIGYRILSVWVSMVALSLVFALVTRLYGVLAGVGALALLTVNFSAVLQARVVSPDVLMPAVTAGVLLLLARGLSVYKHQHPRVPLNAAFAALGLILGLGFYAHPSHFFVVFFAFLFIGYRLHLAHGISLSQPVMGYLRFMVLVFLIISVPYLVSSLRLFELSGWTRLWDGFNLQQSNLFLALFKGLGGLFLVGDADAAYNWPGRPLLDLLSGATMLIGLLAAWNGRKHPRYAMPLLAAAIFVPGAFIAPDSPSFARFSLILPLVGLFFGLGLKTIYNMIHPNYGRRLAIIAVLGLFAFNVVWMTGDLFNRWLALPEAYDSYNGRLGDLADYLDQTTQDTPTVICTQQPANGALSSTQKLLVMMNTTPSDLRFADCGGGMVFLNGGSGQQIIFPRDTTYRTLIDYFSEWMKLGRLVDPLTAPPESVVRLGLTVELANTIGRFTTTSPASYAPEAPAAGTLAVMPVRFGGNLTFLGYEPFSEKRYKAGDTVPLITYWRADGEVPPTARLFAHVLADPSTIVAQNDTISVNLATLRSRDIFIQVLLLPLPIGLPEGDYVISTGVATEDGGRLPVYDPNGQEQGARLFLGVVTVAK